MDHLERNTMKLFKPAKRGTKRKLLANGNTSIGTSGPNFIVSVMLHDEVGNYVFEVTPDQARTLARALDMYADIADKYKLEHSKYETIHSCK
jgi:hypothetical protein